MSAFDRFKSLQELEGDDWGQAEFQSHVAMNAHRLRRVPLGEFTHEDLRFMIGQNIGLQYLIPVALQHLHADPLAEGDCYAGDLLASVLRADSRFWIASPQLRAEVAWIACRGLSLLSTLGESDRQTAEEALTDAHDIFLRAEYFAQHGRT